MNHIGDTAGVTDAYYQEGVGLLITMVPEKNMFGAGRPPGSLLLLSIPTVLVKGQVTIVTGWEGHGNQGVRDKSWGHPPKWAPQPTEMLGKGEGNVETGHR